ncbi:GGDEF domain-containing protein [Permianibacter sp. IMCC34836]|uniref:GGDEF domain-containing protein n=1 Tax=Permianibacter fluminis TaxID=2738515 RepID=UPI0015553753|nr:GGDEF domain-containing protein [Permianibacter fluminis]NQD35935.1 GGDEF domain-containing protein [Permianibacter fluminis]
MVQVGQLQLGRFSLAGRLRALLCLLCLLALPCAAELTLAEVRALPPIPAEYDAWPLQTRIDWLQQQLRATPDSANQYRYQRILFHEYYYDNRTKEATALCQSNEPLRDDIYYRERCILISKPSVDEQLPLLLQLVHEAKQFGNQSAAAQVLADMAWRQSQAGDIAGAFESYELALSEVPVDNAELMLSIMTDTATNYIVNGDAHYINKGIELLAKVKSQSEQRLSSGDASIDRALIEDTIALTEFNTGIAYLLHLQDYQRALPYFDGVSKRSENYKNSSLIFAAVAAAELGRVDQAKAYLRGLSDANESRYANDPVVQQYLTCYRQLAIRHWDRNQSVTACLQLSPATTVEVQLDVYKRLSNSADADIALAGLTRLRDLFVNTLEPQLHRRGSSAASNTEVKRLQRESELKTVVLEQQKELQRERDATNAQRQNLFITLSLLLLVVVLLILSQWRQKKKLAEQFEQLSVKDSLTSLGNRRFLEQQIDREFSQYQRLRRTHPKAVLGIFLIDIDYFKSINDRFGHSVGDQVLVEFSRRIQGAIRDTDLFVRWGGEEFLFVARLESAEQAQQLADRLLATVNGDPFSLPEQEPFAVTCTIGAIKHPFIDGDASSLWNRLVSLADAALYFGKASGRNRWVMIDNVSLSSLDQLDAVLKQPLAHAIEQHTVAVTVSMTH